MLQLVETGADGCDTRARGVDVVELDRPRDLRGIADLGLTLSEAEQPPRRVQQAAVAVQARGHAALRPACSSCGASRHVEGRRSRRVATLFGAVAARPPRFRCPGCGRSEAGTGCRRTCPR